MGEPHPVKVSPSPLPLRALPFIPTYMGNALDINTTLGCIIPPGLHRSAPPSWTAISAVRVLTDPGGMGWLWSVCSAGRAGALDTRQAPPSVPPRRLHRPAPEPCARVHPSYATVFSVNRKAAPSFGWPGTLSSIETRPPYRATSVRTMKRPRP